MIALKFDTQIKGSSKVKGHEDWILVDAIQFGSGRSISSSGSGVDRDVSNPNFSEVSITKSSDIATAELWYQSVCGKSLGVAEFHFIQTAGADQAPQVYLTLKLHDAIVSAYSMSSSGERPSESVSINFTKCEYKYDSFSGDQVTAGANKTWNLMTNETAL